MPAIKSTEKEGKEDERSNEGRWGDSRRRAKWKNFQGEETRSEKDTKQSRARKERFVQDVFLFLFYSHFVAVFAYLCIC